MEDAELLTDIERRGVEDEPLDEDVAFDHPFDPSKIRVTTEPRTIDLLVKRIDRGEIDLAPEFQRRARLWKLFKKSQLIESLLLRIPLPVFYVAADVDDFWSVVDGLQRLTTIHDFIKDAFRLSGLEYLHQLEGDSFSSLPRQMQRRIEETTLVLNIIQPGTPPEVMINIFKRLNTGGLPLTGQEIRNALHKGPIRGFLYRLAFSSGFERATDGRVSDERMDAQECVLRFLAFYTGGWRHYDKNDLDAYLNDAMSRLNTAGEDALRRLEHEFSETMEAAYGIFGRDAFRKRYEPNTARKPVSKALFEAWSVNLANRTKLERAVLVDHSADVRHRFILLMVTDRFFDVSISSSTGTPQRVYKRFKAIEQLIEAVLLEAMQ
jgi:hypothetical protein